MPERKPEARCWSRPDYIVPGCSCVCGCISKHEIHACVYDTCDNKWYDDGSEAW